MLISNCFPVDVFRSQHFRSNGVEQGSHPVMSGISQIKGSSSGAPGPQNLGRSEYLIMRLVSSSVPREMVRASECLDHLPTGTVTRCEGWQLLLSTAVQPNTSWYGEEYRRIRIICATGMSGKRTDAAQAGKELLMINYPPNPSCHLCI